MWSPEVVRELARVAAPGATLATWTVAGGVRAALAGAGFRVEKREGFGNKREMLAGHREGEPAPRAAPFAAARSSSAPASRARWSPSASPRAAGRSDLVDEREKRTGATVGLVRPIANLRDAVNAQASRPAFLYALQHFRALQHDGYHLVWRRCGVLQLADGEDEAARMAAIIAAQGHPPEFLRYVDAARGLRPRRQAGARSRLVDALGRVGVAGEPRRRAPRARRRRRAPPRRPPRRAARARGRRLARARRRADR